MIYQFEREPISGIIMVAVLVDKEYVFKMALDTGASITTFDINPLKMAYYPMGDIIETGLVETASGFMYVSIIKTNTISAFGHTVRDMKVQVYDFLAHGIISEYNGVLGLDFLENTKFTIDLINQTIEILQVKPA